MPSAGLSTTLDKFKLDKKKLGRDIGKSMIDIIMRDRPLHKDSSGNFKTDKNKKDMIEELSRMFGSFMENDAKLTHNFIKTALITIDAAVSPSGAVTGTAIIS